MIGGTGTVQVTHDGRTDQIAVSGPPTLHQIVTDDPDATGELTVHVPAGMTAYSFTYG